MPVSPNYQPTSQERFNHGFFDGMNAAKNNRLPEWVSPHFDSIYEAGYFAGKVTFVEIGETDSSLAAWEEYTRHD